MAPVDVWCGLNTTLVLLEAESGDKQVQGCGCGSRGRLPGHLEGSPVFVRLSVKVCFVVMFLLFFVPCNVLYM